MFDSRQTKAEIIEGSMKLHAAYVEKCAENERLRAVLNEVVDTIARKALISSAAQRLLFNEPPSAYVRGILKD